MERITTLLHRPDGSGYYKVKVGKKVLEMSPERYEMGRSLGRLIKPMEEVRFHDGNPKNLLWENLYIVKRKIVPRKSNMVTLKCINCGAVFERREKIENLRLAMKRQGPFCSKRCSGATGRGKIF